MTSKPAVAGINVFLVVRARMAVASTNGWSRAAGWFYNCTNGMEHHHGAIGNPNLKPYGNGVLLWFEIEDFDAAVARAREMNVEVVMPRHRNPPEGHGGPNHWEIWLHDPDGYTVVLVSPDGSADGNWKP